VTERTQTIDFQLATLAACMQEKGAEAEERAVMAAVGLLGGMFKDIARIADATEEANRMYRAVNSQAIQRAEYNLSATGSY